MVTFAAATKTTSTIPPRAPAQHRVDHFVAITCSDPNDSCDLYSDDCRSHAQLVSPSRDPIGYVDGAVLYAACFVPSGSDPTGTQKVTVKDKKGFEHDVEVVEPHTHPIDFGKCSWGENGTQKDLTFEAPCTYKKTAKRKVWIDYDWWYAAYCGERGIWLEQEFEFERHGVFTRGALHRCDCKGSATGTKTR